MSSSSFEKKLQPTVVIATWNVNELASEKDLSSWLDYSPGKKADIYSIGFQECDNTISSHFTLSANHLLEAYNKSIANYFGEQNKSDYHLLVSEKLGGLYSLVYVKKTLLPQISAVATAFYKLGMLCS